MFLVERDFCRKTPVFSIPESPLEPTPSRSFLRIVPSLFFSPLRFSSYGPSLAYRRIASRRRIRSAPPFFLRPATSLPELRLSSGFRQLFILNLERPREARFRPFFPFHLRGTLPGSVALAFLAGAVRSFLLPSF